MTKKKEKEKESDMMSDISSYLKGEARTHIKHWKDIKRESDRIFSEVEGKTKKIMLKTSGMVKEDDFVVLHEYNHKLQMLNMEAVKVNSRLLFIIQLSSSFGVDLDLDTTYADTAKSVLGDKSAGFLFYDDKTRLRYIHDEIREMFHEMSVGEVKKMGVVQAYELIKSQYAEFLEMKANATGKKETKPE